MSESRFLRITDAEYSARLARREGQQTPQAAASSLPNKREAKRTKADYILEYHLAGRDNSGIGRALDHSENGIRFVSHQPLEPGSYLTIRVLLRSKTVSGLTCLANVVRCMTLPKGRGYAVGCAYD